MALAASIPVARDHRRARILAVPVYWHLLSLDAPTVAVLWAWSFGGVAHVRSSLSAVTVLGIGTWLIYVADRLLDGRPAARHRNLRDRHLFHRRHRHAFLLTGAAAAILLLWLIAARISPAARREDSVLFAASMIYFVIVHRPDTPMRRWFRREFAVGLVFACATVVPAWSRPAALRQDLLLPTLLFAALCCLNCLAIDEWEKTPLPTPLSRPGSPRNRRFPVSPMCIVVAAAAASLCLAGLLRHSAVVPVSAAVFASALLLLMLDRLRRRAAHHHSHVSALGLRIAADAALLTPLLLVLPWRA